MNDELLTPLEAARLIRSTRNSVYRWCRDGRLPAVKVGGVWRIPRSALEPGGHDAAAPPPPGQTGDGFAPLVEWPDLLDQLARQDGQHWLVITPSQAAHDEVDASFASRGLASGHRVVKGTWGGDLDDARARLQAHGIDVEAAERAGAIVFVDMGREHRRGGLDAVLDRWEDLRQGAQRLGLRGMWKSGSPVLDDTAPFQAVVEVEHAAAAFFSRPGSLAICPVYPSDHPEWHERLTRLLASHEAAVYRSSVGSIVLRPAV